MRTLLRLLKGVYDILASYFLAWVLVLALLAWGLYGVFSLGLSVFSTFESVESFWLWADRELPVRAWIIRVAIFGTLQLVVLYSLRRRIGATKKWLEGRADRLIARYRRWSKGGGVGHRLFAVSFSLGVTALMVPFVIQPTMVPLAWGADAWSLRAANLVDGSASAAAVESVVGLYRKLFAEPVIAKGVSDKEFDDSSRRPPPPDGVSGGNQPMMDRWDSTIRRAVKNDPRAFAQVKAFLWVESGGRQFAVSRTGCTGLMQFCSRTARSGGFRAIFGVGQVYPCRCRGRCSVSRSVQRSLESGDPARIKAQAPSFVCDLADARFDPQKAIRAGELFIRRLGQQLGNNLYLMYIGYNSGPGIARALYRRLGSRGEVDLPTIAARLPSALSRHYGTSANARARSLAQVHLPKLKRAYDSYLAQAAAWGKPPIKPPATPTPTRANPL